MQAFGFPCIVTGMTNTTQRIANRVRGVAAEHGFTQQRIADATGLSRTSVVERINGRVSFTAAELLDLATAMNVPVARLFPEPSAQEVAA